MQALHGTDLRIRCALSLAWVALALTVTYTAGCGQKNDNQAASSSQSAESTVLQEAINTWRAAGGVIELSEISSGSVPAGGQNAADYYVFMQDRLYDIPEQHKKTLNDPWELTDVQLNASFKFYKDLTEEIKQAARMPGCDWKIDYTQGEETPLGFLGASRTMARLLQADAILKAHAGDHAGAFDSIECGLLVGDHLSESGMLVSLLVDMSIRSLMYGTINQIYSTDDIEADLTPLLEVLDVSSFDAKLKPILMNEITMLIGEARKRRLGSHHAPLLESANDAFAAELTAFLNDVTESIPTIDGSTHPIGTFNVPDIPSSWSSNAEMWVRNQSRIGPNVDLVAGYREMARTAITLRTMKQRTGSYPDPEEFDAPINPATGEPLLYERLGSGGFRLTMLLPEGFEREPEIWEWD